jgi:formylglycine-generating enzyme required for sulfatase activity
LPATCGAGADEDCCSSPSVAGGTFYRGYDGIEYGNTGYPATVSTFELDRFEVTVGRFRAFLDAGMGTQANPPAAGDGAHPLIAGSGWSAAWDSELEVDRAALEAALECGPSRWTWTDAPGANEALPINCITWYEAFAFCAWDGARLPTETESHYAASGGDEQRYFPWSASYPPGSTTIDATHASYDCLGDGSAAGSCALADILAVGSLSPTGDGRWGQADLAGNLLEWALDAPNLYSNPPYVNPCDDCAALTGTVGRIRRGGEYSDSDTDDLRTVTRLVGAEDSRTASNGLRCARNP